MKPEGTVRHKLRQAQYRHLKRELRNGLSTKPENCGHNSVLELPGATLRICSLGSPQEGYAPCDETYGGLEQASRCPHFSCLHTPESIRREVKEFFTSSTPAQVALRYPDVAALMWVLEEGPGEPEESLEEDAGPAPTEPSGPPPPTPLRILQEASEEAISSERGYRLTVPEGALRVLVHRVPLQGGPR